MGGLYARYSTSAIGTATARAAKIDYAVNYEFSGYGSLGTVSGDNNDVYVVMETFSVENTGEVAYTYNLGLVLSKDIATATYDEPAPQTNFSLAAPLSKNTVKYVYHPSGNLTEGAVQNNTSVQSLIGKEVVEARKAYYAYSADGINYTWVEATLNGDYLMVQAPESLIPGQQYHYKIIYFIHITASTKLPQQQMTLFYSITCEQIN
jgi:hypothetical protein